MRYIENIVIGTPVASPESMFATDDDDWKRVEEEKTYFTEDRFLPKILVDLGIYPSISEIRRNRKDLVVTLNDVCFIDKLKVSKKRTVYILVGK